MRKFDSGIWQKSITGGCFGAPLVTLGRSGRKGSRAAAAACLALDASRADCHSPDQQVLLDDLEVLHVHVFLAAPLGTRHVAKPRTDQHQGGVAIGECPHHTGAPADLTIQPLDHVVGTDACPMFAGEIAVGQRFFNAVLDFPGSLLQLHGAQKGEFMRTGLTKQEKTTDIWFDEKDPIIHIRTHNIDLKNRLTAYDAAYPGECRQTDADPDTAAWNLKSARGGSPFG